MIFTSNTIRQTIVVITLALGTGAILASPASACSCRGGSSAERILDRSAALFTGIARESDPLSPGKSVTTFRVIETFKGVAVGDRVKVIHSNRPTAACGVRFTSGMTYTLSAHRSQTTPDFTTSFCSTRMFNPKIRSSTKLIERIRALSGK